MRGNIFYGFTIIKVVAKLGAFRFLAIGQLGHQHAVLLHVLTQVAQQGRIFGKLFHQNLARTFQRCLHIRHAGILVAFAVEKLRLEILGCFDLWH